MPSDDPERPTDIWQAKAREDVDYLVRALVDPENRIQAATFLGQLQADEATAPLLRLLDANDSMVRFAASRALGWIGSDQARSRLREIVAQDDDDGVRAEAVVALGEIGCPDDLEFLVPLLDDPSLRVRGGTAVALGTLGDARALEPLRAARPGCNVPPSSGTGTAERTTKRLPVSGCLAGADRPTGRRLRNPWVGGSRLQVSVCWLSTWGSGSSSGSGRRLS